MLVIKSEELTPARLSQLGETQKLHIYNLLDVCVTLEVLEAIKPQLTNLGRNKYEFSKALQGPILEMKLRGTLIDEAERVKAVAAYHKDVALLEGQLMEILIEGLGLDPSFNWRSPAQLKVLLYEHLRLPPIRKRNSKGQLAPTVNRDALERLTQYFDAQPIINHILALRDIGKKIGVLETEVDSDGRMRTSYNIAGTNTGRLSSSFSDFGTGTNLQNVEERLRRVFWADPGMKFAYIDLEQAESRLVGAICWNRFHASKYLDACESGDLHTTVVKMTSPQLNWTGDPSMDKDIAEQPYYRQHSYRHMNKVLGHGCLTGDHEVLTREGWVSILSKPDEIMMWEENNQGKVSSYFGLVRKWTEYDYGGDLHEFEGNSMSALMTADHRIPYKADQRTAGIKTRFAADGPQTFMPLGNGYVGGFITAPARLIAAFQADGSQSESGISFHFNKERKADRLIDLCRQYGYECKRYTNSDGTLKLYVKTPELSILMSHLDWPKHPGSYLFDWTRESLIDFIDELKYWDGHQGNTSISLFSTIRTDLEWYQLIGRILGIGGAIQKPQISGFGSTVYSLQQNHRQFASGSSSKWRRIKQTGTTKVLCPTVDTHWFYVRRNGKIFVTGNSNYLGQPNTMEKHTKIPSNVIAEFQGKYFGAFPEIPQWHAWTKQEIKETGRLISLMGRERSFFGRRDDPATIREAVAFDPQGSVADILNTGMLQIWRADICQLLMQIHDAVLIQYPEDKEDEIVPLAIELIKVKVELLYGRTLLIPSDAKVGWNWANWYKDKLTGATINPDGLKKYKSHDDRTRSRSPS